MSFEEWDRRLSEGGAGIDSDTRVICEVSQVHSRGGGRRSHWGIRGVRVVRVGEGWDVQLQAQKGIVAGRS